MYYSIRWERLQIRKNIIQVQITLLDEQGECHKKQKYYEEWIGVCTNNIDQVSLDIQRNFPGHRVKYQHIGEAKKVLPYFEKRLAKGKLDYRSKPFYKVYTTASHKDVGRFFNRYKIGYYEPEDWLIRIYIDFCFRYNTHAFYYSWYEVDDAVPGLMDSFCLIPDRKDQPDWTIASFDIESVPMKGNHVPMGDFPTDRIVMISLYKWNQRHGVRNWLLYVLPDSLDQALSGYEYGFKTESDMLIKFHDLIQDAQVLTGYYINDYDFRCLFARCLWLKLSQILDRYSSENVGTHLVVTYDNKLTLDLNPYFKSFSTYGLKSFKLDDVARAKLGGDSKLPVKSTGIWCWYRTPGVPRELYDEEDVEKTYKFLKPKEVRRVNNFGTFRTYLDYCLKDSELTYRLFEKEHVLSFLVERANFCALNAVEALHLGNSRYWLELFKTYGLRLGFFVNPKFLIPDDSKKQLLIKGEKTYQGALNYCKSQSVYEDVAVMDFASMYPSTLLNTNLCYGTCTILSREEWLDTPSVHGLLAIPYEMHTDLDFEREEAPTQFSYPLFEKDKHPFVIVVNPHAKAFLPEIVSHFIAMRKYHQMEWKKTQVIYHYNVQLGIKILINTLYGVMANKNSPLAYLVIAIAIVTLSRYQLLASHYYLRNKGYDIVYADTDSLMVHRWPVENCDEVNRFLGLPNVELKYEQRMKRLVVLCKKRYVYERYDGQIITKGFQVKCNDLVEFMTRKILKNVWGALFENQDASVSRGWVIWVELLLEANYFCRDPMRYSIYRKVKKLEEYKSRSFPSVKFLLKYPNHTDEYIEFTYNNADIAFREASNWVVDPDDCTDVNFEQLFKSQKKIFTTLLDIAYWHYTNFKIYTFLADMVINTIHWKRFMHVELKHYHATGRKIAMLVQNGLKYTFTMNNHIYKNQERKRKLLTLDLEEQQI